MKKSPKSAPPSTSESSTELSENVPPNTTERRGAKSKAIASFRLGKDEMNLVEHPFALLRRGDSDSLIYLEWDKVHPRTGKTIRAKWRVSGDPKLGLPGPVEERLYLILMELSREAGFPRKVMFSRYDVLKRLGLTRTAPNYAMLRDAFLRLKTVTIEAKNSFWLARVNDFAALKMFSLIDEVNFVDEVAGVRKGQIPLALSSFVWSDTMFLSLVAGNIRSLNIDFALSLDLPLAARLFRYLDKHRTGGAVDKRRYEIELHRLCEIHLGMAPAKYPSKLKERLLPALEELKRRGFLMGWAYEEMKSAPGETKIVFEFSGIVPAIEKGEGEGKSHVPAQLVPAGIAPEAELSLFPDASQTPGAQLMTNLTRGIEWAHEQWRDCDDEFSRLDLACDAVFEALDEAVRTKINARALATLPSYLRSHQNTPGARTMLEKERRAIVWSEHKDAVYASLGDTDEGDED